MAAAADQKQQRRPYQVVMAATREMGISKDGELPWDLPTDRQFFEDVTTITSDPGKRNAVVMGRLSWEGIPVNDRPLCGRFNVILTRSVTPYIETTEDVVCCGSLDSALAMLAEEPYSSSIERVFVTGGGQILRDGLHADGCEAIHLTEIEASMECDKFMPRVNTRLFRPWNVSFPVVENGTRHSFTAYVRTTVPNEGGESKLERWDFLPGMVYARHEEVPYLYEVKDILLSRDERVDMEGNKVWSKLGCQIGFNLRKTFPLMTTTTKGISWQGVVKELIRFIGGGGSNTTKENKCVQNVDHHHDIADVINKINNSVINQTDGGALDNITLSGWNPSSALLDLPSSSFHALAQFSIEDGELSCRVFEQEADMGFDVPFNVASYALITCFIARVCDLLPGDLNYEIGEAYVPCTDTELLQQKLLQNSPQPFPILEIISTGKNKDIHSFATSDFQLITS